MQSFVEEYQEKKLKAESCGSTLIIKPVVAMENPEASASTPAQAVFKKSPPQQQRSHQSQKSEEISENSLGDDDETNVNRLAGDFWKNHFSEDSVVPTENFLESLQKVSPVRGATALQTDIIQSGLKDFFGNQGDLSRKF